MKEAVESKKTEVKKEDNTNIKIEEIKEEKSSNKKEEKLKKEKHDKHSKKEEEKIKKLEEENKELLEKVAYSKAELVNYRKRKDEEVSNMLKYANKDILLDLLQVVDNFERSIEMDKSTDEKYLEGYKMIYVNLCNILKNYGVEEIDCNDKEFDPNTMNALMTEHVDGVESDHVLTVLQKGYMYKDKLLRPAMVKVSE